MNRKRRKSIEDVHNKLRSLSEILTELYNEEQDAYDSMPENLQSSDRGMDSEEAIDLIEEAISNIDDAIDKLSDIL